MTNLSCHICNTNNVKWIFEAYVDRKLSLFYSCDKHKEDLKLLNRNKMKITAVRPMINNPDSSSKES
jgi:hypothetical protein